MYRYVFFSLLMVAAIMPTGTVFAQPQNPPVKCLPGQGPLAPGQQYCGKTLHLLGIDLGCYPHLPPDDSQGDGCGLDDFITFLRGVINYLTIIIFPLAAAMLVWGGLVIMTAAGSTERVGKGKQIITTAIIGVAIALGSWLIINAIYLALTGFGV